MQPKLSILIPCYNVSNFIHKLVASITNQKQFLNGQVKIICLDDGSTDNTYEILNKISQCLTNNFQIAHQKNVGLALTRNNLIKLCNTEYFVFVDADDYLCDNALLEYSEAINKGCNLAFFRAYWKTENNISIFALTSNCNRNYDIRKYVCNNIPFIWNVIIKKKFYIECHASYLKVKDIGEDLYMCSFLSIFALGHNVTDILFSPEITYVYVENKSSYMHNDIYVQRRYYEPVDNLELFMSNTKNYSNLQLRNVVCNNYIFAVIYNLKHEYLKTQNTEHFNGAINKIKQTLNNHNVVFSLPECAWKIAEWKTLKMDCYFPISFIQKYD